jgi:hypothetical protein
MDHDLCLVDELQRLLLLILPVPPRDKPRLLGSIKRPSHRFPLTTHGNRQQQTMPQVATHRNRQQQTMPQARPFGKAGSATSFPSSEHPKRPRAAVRPTRCVAAREPYRFLEHLASLIPAAGHGPYFRRAQSPPPRASVPISAVSISLVRVSGRPPVTHHCDHR